MPPASISSWRKWTPSAWSPARAGAERGVDRRVWSLAGGQAPPPEASTAFVERYDRWFKLEVRTLDEAFGVERPKGMQIDDQAAERERLRPYIVLRVEAWRTLWCEHTYLLDCFLISPRLAIRSVTHRCGKTTLLDTVSHLALRTLSSANVTAASVFRVIEACRPTVLIDEADTFLLGAEDLRGVINSGHRKGGSVIRTVGDDHEPRIFSTYGACAAPAAGMAHSHTAF